MPEKTWGTDMGCKSTEWTHLRVTEQKVASREARSAILRDAQLWPESAIYTVGTSLPQGSNAKAKVTDFQNLRQTSSTSWSLNSRASLGLRDHLELGNIIGPTCP